jgi:hypothetical protein
MPTILTCQHDQSATTTSPRDDALPFEPNIGVPIKPVNYLGATNVWHCDSWMKGSTAALAAVDVLVGGSYTIVLYNQPLKENVSFQIAIMLEKNIPTLLSLPCLSSP